MYRNRLSDGGFTLIEMLVSIAVIAILVSLVMPWLSKARTLALVLRAHSDMRAITVALEAYQSDHHYLPPARTYCLSITHKVDDYFELPPELIEYRYLDAPVYDIFNPERTYKYLSPGYGYANNTLTRHNIWVPESFPHESGKDVLYRDQASSPVKYALWSVGPAGPRSAFESRRLHHPVPQRLWYPNEKDGIIVWLFTGNSFITSP